MGTRPDYEVGEAEGSCVGGADGDGTALGVGDAGAAVTENGTWTQLVGLLPGLCEHARSS
jgi:hypothetical protein